MSPGGGVLSVNSLPADGRRSATELPGHDGCGGLGSSRVARVVHIISTPWDKTNPIAGRKAAATKDHYDNPVEGIYVFNPNTGLRAAAQAEHMTEEQQGAEWLRLWGKVLESEGYWRQLLRWRRAQLQVSTSWKEAGRKARCRSQNCRWTPLTLGMWVHLDTGKASASSTYLTRSSEAGVRALK